MNFRTQICESIWSDIVDKLNISITRQIEYTTAKHHPKRTAKIWALLEQPVQLLFFRLQCNSIDEKLSSYDF